MKMTNEEAIKQMEEFIVIDDWSLVYLPDLHDALELAIKALKRPHGEWRGNTERRNMVTRICTSCGDRSVVGYFCMWCGADMRTKEGERNDTETSKDSR